MSENKEPIFHLLVPKEFRTWCIRHRPPGPKMNLTQFPSKCNCAVCLTNWRWSKGHKKTFRVKWTNRHNPISCEPKIEE